MFPLAANYLLISVNCFAQPSITWQKLYDNPYNYDNYCFRVNNVDSVSFYLTGVSRITGNNYGTQIIKIDKYGSVLSDKTFDTISLFKWASLTTPDLGCVLVGNGPQRFKVNSNAEIVWSKNDGYILKS